MKFYDDIEELSEEPRTKKPKKEIELSAEEKQRRAEVLISKKVNNKDILGYITEDNLKVKYDKATGDYVVYNNNSEIIFFDIFTVRQYESNKWSTYMYMNEI